MSTNPEKPKTPAGPVSIPPSKPKAEFTFRPTGGGGPKTDLPPNPALERFREPEPPTPLERMLPLIKGVVGGLAVLLLLLIALYYVPLPGQDEVAALDRATSALQTLRALPAQHQPVLSLRDATLPLRNSAAPDLVAALLAVVALGEMRTGDRATGLKQCEYIVNTYTGAPAAQLVKFDALSEPCRNCKGAGRVAEALRPGRSVQAMDGDTVMCLKCQGKGRLFSGDALEAQYAKALEVAGSTITSQNRRGALLSFLLRLQSRLHRAFGRTQPGTPPPPTGTTNAPAV